MPVVLYTTEKAMIAGEHRCTAIPSRWSELASHQFIAVYVKYALGFGIRSSLIRASKVQFYASAANDKELCTETPSPTLKWGRYADSCT